MADIEQYRNPLVTIAPADLCIVKPEIVRTRTAVSESQSVNSHDEFPNMATPENPTASCRLEMCHNFFTCPPAEFITLPPETTPASYESNFECEPGFWPDVTLTNKEPREPDACFPSRLVAEIHCVASRDVLPACSRTVISELPKFPPDKNIENVLK